MFSSRILEKLVRHFPREILLEHEAPSQLQKNVSHAEKATHSRFVASTQKQRKDRHSAEKRHRREIIAIVCYQDGANNSR